LLAAPATNSPDRLQFLSGATLHGSLQAIDTNSGLHWQHPEARNAFAVQPTHLDYVRFAQSQAMTVSPVCQFHFANGDNLFGSLVSLSDDSMEFTTWFGSTMKIPRAALQTISFLPKNYSLIYEGPGDASEWVVANGVQQGRVIVQNGAFGGVVIMGGGMINAGGGLVNINGINYLNGATSSGPPWEFRDAAYVASGQGTLGREFHLSRSCTVEFDLSCSSAFSLWLALYSAAPDQIDPNNCISLTLANNVNFRRPRSTFQTGDLGGVVLPDFEKHNAAHLAIHCNKEDGSVTLLQDGVVLQRWNDISINGGLGGGIVFQNQLPGNNLKLSNFKVSQWDGVNEPESGAAALTNTDFVSFLNHDRAAGKIGGIAEGKLSLEVAGRPLRVPAERVRTISFAQSSAASEPRGPWEVRAIFPGGGTVSFQLAQWDGQSVSGHSALFGDVSFPTASIRQLQFNLDHPKQNPALPRENEFDVLDQ
jgi:hypothetical protein